MLADKLEALAAALRHKRELVDAVGAFVRTAEDDALVRVNPVRFAAEHGFTVDAVLETFLHARKVELFTMEWQ
jgi:hypothetical protein